MFLSKKLLTLAAPAALLALSACATGFPAQVSRFQAMPAPQGETFIIRPADSEDRGGLEFSRYASLVRRHARQLKRDYDKARGAIGKNAQVVEVPDEGAVIDVDDPATYERLFGSSPERASQNY